MSTIIRRFIDKIYPRSGSYTVTIVGLGWSGKTTLLYLLKLGEVVQTVSSFGFNVETVEAPTTSGRPLKLTGWDIGGGCSGIHHVSKLIDIYAARGDALIWMVDSSDPGTLLESVEGLTLIIKGIDALRFMEPAPQKDYPILILANKQDSTKAIPIDEIRKAFATTLHGRTACIFKVSMTQDILKGGLPDAFNWLSFALENISAERPVRLPKSNAAPDLRSSTFLADKLESWLTRVETDSSPHEFINQFDSLNLPSWDHYTHIRIAFLLLATYGRQKGKDLIFGGIERYIAESSQARGRTFHVTMTYFWVQIVHLGISSMAPPTSSSFTQSPNLEATIVHPMTSSPEKFGIFLLLNPYVADGNLWEDYYSKGVMMSPLAKGGMVLPDKKQLPNLVVRDAI